MGCDGQATGLLAKGYDGHKWYCGGKIRKFQLGGGQSTAATGVISCTEADSSVIRVS